MLQLPVDIINHTMTASSDTIVLDRETHSHDGLVPFYRGELFLSEPELKKLNEYFQSIDCPFGIPRFVEVSAPPLIQNYLTPVATAATFSPIPARSTRASFPNYGTSIKTTASGGKGGSGKSVRSSVAPIRTEPERQRKQELSAPMSDVADTPRIDSSVNEEIPIIPPKRQKIQEFVTDVFAELNNDRDYQTLYEEALPNTLSVPISMLTIRDRIEKGIYEDHFQFQDDLIALASFWLHGPPMPNPMLPQYMAALKLLRQSTEVMIARCGEVENGDYYTGPDVEAAIKAEAKRAQVSQKPSHTTSPSFARKIKKPQPASSSANGELKEIESQIAKLTNQVLGMQKSSRSSGPSVSAPVRHEAMTAEEIRRLEADLIKLSPEDIDYIISNMLKDEPSVKVDDESYELDVGALPAAKQRSLRRFVTRRLNIADPTHEAQKLKQMLKQDELARASEEMAHRLLAASAVAMPSMPVAPLAPIAPIQPMISPEEEERQRKREEEAKRLWRLANGEDDEDMDLD